MTINFQDKAVQQDIKQSHTMHEEHNKNMYVINILLHKMI
jgi:hypothetical protein